MPAAPDRSSRSTATGVLALALAAASAPAVAVDARFDADRGLLVRSGDFRAEFGARLHVDGAAYSGGTAATTGEDGLLLRRARIVSAFDYGRRWTARADYEFGEVGPGFKNLWVQYAIDRRTDVRVGSQVAPFGHEDVMSSDYLPFMERSLASAFGPGLLTGAAIRHSSRRWTFAGGVYGNNLSDDDRRDLDGRSVVARVTHVPYREGPVIVHVGASGEFRDASNDATFRLRPPLETRVGRTSAVDTGRLRDVESLVNVGLETGVRVGPVLLHGEYVTQKVGRTGAAPDLAFDGWYVAGTWALTGERRRYSAGSGAFSRIDRPEGPLGAFELTARYGTIDLTDEDVIGGEQTNASVGLNWYWNPRVRAMLSHVWVDAEQGGVDVDAPDLTMLRFQYSF